MSKLKAVVVKMAGQGEGDSTSERVLLEPGTKVSDLLERLNLSKGFRLSYNDSFLDPSSDIYDLVGEGDILFSSTDPQVGA